MPAPGQMMAPRTGTTHFAKITRRWVIKSRPDCAREWRVHAKGARCWNWPIAVAGFLISVRASSSNNVRRAAIVARFFPPILAPKVADLMAQQQSGESSHQQR